MPSPTGDGGPREDSPFIGGAEADGGSVLEGRSMALFEVPARSPPEQQAARRALSRVDKSRGPSPKTPPLTVNRGSRHGLGEPLGGAGSRPSGEPCPPRPAGGPTRCGLEPQAWAPGLPSPCLGPPARFGSGGLRAGRAGPWLICSVWGHLSQRWVTGSASWPQTGGNGQQPHGVLAAQQAGQLHQPEPGRRGARGGRGQPEAGSQGACPSPSAPPKGLPSPDPPPGPWVRPPLPHPVSQSWGCDPATSSRKLFLRGLFISGGPPSAAPSCCEGSVQRPWGSSGRATQVPRRSCGVRARRAGRRPETRTCSGPVSGEMRHVFLSVFLAPSPETVAKKLAFSQQ